MVIVDREAREIMYLVAPVRPSVHLSPISRLKKVMYLVASVRLSVCALLFGLQFGAKKSHYQSKEFVCVSVISGCGRSAFILSGVLYNTLKSN